jgi:hypothetical protein
MMRSALTLWGCLLVAPAALPCTIIVDEAHPRPTPQSLVDNADAIVVARAVRTVDPANREQLFSRGRPPDDDVERLFYGTVELRIDETIKGDAGAATLTIVGTLAGRDDFNPLPVPYPTVRPGGSTGACYAYEYRGGAAYLLFLKRSRSGGLTPYWAPLQPVNEQLRDGRDPWLLWVRQQVAAA